jgi:PAS domain S-box-containing protein
MNEDDFVDKIVELRSNINNLWYQLADNSHSDQIAPFIENLNDGIDTIVKDHRKFHSLAKNAPSGLAIIDKNGNFTYINSKFKEMFGYDLSEIPCGRDWFRKAFPNPVYRHEAISAWVRDLNESRPCEKRPRIFKVTCKDGDEKTIKFVSVQQEDGENLLSCEDISEKDRANKTLYASLHLLETIIDTIPNPFFYRDKNGIFRACNKVFSQLIFGLTKEEIIGHSLYDLLNVIPNELAEIFYSHEKRLIHEGGVQIYESQVPCADGTTRIFSFNEAVLTDSVENFVGIIGVMLDVTEYGHNEEILRRSQEKYRDLVENINEIIYSLDENGDFTYISPVVKRFGGYDPSEILGRNFRDFVFEEDLSAVVACIQRILCGNAESLEFRALKKSGEERWIQVSSRPILKDGEITGLQGVITEIDKRKRAEDALRESEQEKAAILNGLKNVAVLYLDPKMRIIWLNNAVQKNLGLSDSDIKGRHCFELIQHLKEPCIGCTAAKALQTGLSSEGELVTPDGKTWLSRSSPIKDNNNRITGAVNVSLNISNRKRTEDALKESERHLTEIIEFLPDPTFVINSKGEVLAWNRAIEALTGIKSAEILGKGNYDYALPFYGKRRPILIDLVLKPDPNLEE